MNRGGIGLTTANLEFLEGRKDGEVGDGEEGGECRECREGGEDGAR